MREVGRNSGPLIGFPIIDFEVSLTRRFVSRRRLVGAGLRDRGRAAMREAAAKAGIKLLEPVMKVEVRDAGRLSWAT